MTARANKYGNQKVEVDGYVFASKREARRYGELKLMERAGQICALTLQPRFPMVINGEKVCTYVADFEYLIPADQGARPERIVEDVKGVRTDAYKIKAKLLKALHGIDVVEV